jgi:dolichol-phosphate mannosyltransferase
MDGSFIQRIRQAPVPRVARFAIIGTSGVGVNTAVLWLLIELGGLPLLWAGALAIESAICSNFVLNDGWTFHQATRRRPWWQRAVAFHGTAALAAVINLSLLLLLATVAGMHYVAANLLAITLAAAVNYGGNALWTWRPAAPAARLPATIETARSQVVVVVPTYNEAQNVRRLTDAVLALGPQYRLLFVDDASPDGTGDIVEERAAREPRVRLLRRPSKLGLGTAYVAGFREGIRWGADLIVQMDSDFSHDPSDLPRLVAAAATSDVVIGSRYVAGGGSVNWPWQRQLISRGTGLAYRALLGLPQRDLSGGFKCWRRDVLEDLPLSDVRCRGFAFQIEMNYLCWRAGFAISEVPVLFRDREHGQSKMSVGISLEGAALLWRLALGTPAPARQINPG